MSAANPPLTFVLVHGAFHGGWCWRHVADRLRATGAAVFTPTMTGLGERAHLLSRAVGIETFFNDVTGLIAAEELNDVVLVGHSFGGVVISGAADRIPDKVRQSDLSRCGSAAERAVRDQPAAGGDPPPCESARQRQSNT